MTTNYDSIAYFTDPSLVPDRGRESAGLIATLDQDAALEVTVESPAGDVGAHDKSGVPVDIEHLRMECGAGRGAMSCRPGEPAGPQSWERLTVLVVARVVNLALE